MVQGGKLVGLEHFGGAVDCLSQLANGVNLWRVEACVGGRVIVELRKKKGFSNP